MSEWKQLRLPQYVKMFDPTSQNKNEDKDEEEIDIPESDNDDIMINIEQERDQQKLERDKAKYRSEVKFHYLITESGELGKALPEILEVQNP